MQAVSSQKINPVKLPNELSDEASKSITLRPREKTSSRFLLVVKASKRSKASILHECVEAELPKLEKRYQQQIREFLAQSKLAKAA